MSSIQGEDDGETWRASVAPPGIIACDDFAERGDHGLVIRLTEGPQGGRKTITVNGTGSGTFVRNGPLVTERKEW